MKTRRVLLLTSVLAAITGCSSGGTASGGNNFGLTGNWKGIIESYRVSGSPHSIQYAAIIEMNIVQDVAGNITGLVTVNDHDTQCWFGGEISEDSNVKGNSIVFGWTDQTGAEVTAQGTATSNTIQALYTSTAGGDCQINSGAISLTRS